MEDNYFIISWWFLPISTWSSHRYTCVSPILNPPPHPIPLDCPRALALGTLLHASNSHWLSILHAVMYMFQCCSLKSCYPLLLSLSSEVLQQFQDKVQTPAGHEGSLSSDLCLSFQLHFCSPMNREHSRNIEALVILQLQSALIF